MQILIQFPFTPEQIGEFRSLAASLGDHEVVHAENEEQARELAPEAEVILGHFPESVAEVAHRLRWIQSYSAGMNNFLYPSVIERDEVMVSNMAGLYAPQGGEHAWALLLALSRGLLPSIRNMAERAWGGGVDSVELAGGTLGVIGMGGFGRETTKRAAGYGMRIIGLDPVHHLTGVQDVSQIRAPSADNLRWLLETADAVVVGCPLTDETYHMIGAEQLLTMKRTAYLVCVSRGGIIDEPPLARALHEGIIAGAGLDVCETEPPPEDSPLWGAPNLILTPHRAGASQHRPRKTFEFFRDNLRRYLAGETPANVVDKRKGY